MAYGVPSANLERTAGFTRELANRYVGVETPWGTLYDLSRPPTSGDATATGN